MSNLQEYNVALNFFPLLSEDFQLTVYRLRQTGEGESRPEGSRAWRLPLAPGAAYERYWVSFEPRPGFEPYLCLPRDNLYVTTAFLHCKLIEKSQNTLELADYQVEHDFRPRVSYILARHPEGEERVWLEPYFLNSTRELGFLADFTFTPKLQQLSSRRVQQLSLSLDAQFRENRNFYADRYDKLRQFVRVYLHRLFPLSLDGSNPIGVLTDLSQLAAHRLDVKTYVFRGGATSRSQFMGVKNSGPLQRIKDDPLLCFLYRSQDRPLAHDLYRALRGDTYATFPGMEKIFAYSLRSDHVYGIGVSSFTEEDLNRAVEDSRLQAGEKLVVPVILLPWSREEATDAQDRLYFWLKHRFLAHGLPTQFVSIDTLKDPFQLKWAVANIALGVFAKMGGVPWKVRPRQERCLIIGIGQSHKIRQGRVERYFAYSVLTDSSGLYEDLVLLGRSVQEAEYLGQFRRNLTDVLRKYAERFDRFAIHSTFSLRRSELDTVCDVLRSYSEETSQSKELVALKFNDRNKYFGFAPANNSLIPYESSYVPLSDTDYLVWFEGLQYHKPNVDRRIGGPMHVTFMYPKVLADEQKRGYLQDAINLSGANWRGFNAKSSPVSVYYAYQIARYFREFTSQGLEELDLSQLTPWFL